MDDPFDLPPDVLRRVPLFAELSKVLSWTGGPVNWDLARQIAVSIAAGESPDAAVTQADHDAVDEHVRLAERWLAETTCLEANEGLQGRAATPMDWAEGATTSLRDLIDPVAAKVSAAMGEQGQALGGADDAAMVTQALGQMAPMFLGIQCGSILGTIAREVTGAHDLPVPADEPAAVLILPAVDRFAASFALDRAVVRQWASLRAVAHRLAFDGFPRTRFFALYLDLVASLHFDFGDGIRRLQELDLSDPARLQDALSDEGLFTHEQSSESRAAARRIAELQGVVDAVVDAAVRTASVRAGDVTRITEAFARRRADRSGDAMLQRFIGLEASPAPSGSSFVARVLDARGWPALGRLWSDPDSFPSEAELADPDAWLERNP